jgi:hypothetical protein
MGGRCYAEGAMRLCLVHQRASLRVAARLARRRRFCDGHGLGRRFDSLGGSRRRCVDGGRGLGCWSRRCRLDGPGGVGNGRRGRLCGRRGRRRRARRQQGERIDIALRIARHARAEVHVRIREPDHAARPDGPDDRPFPDECTSRHADRPQVDERRGVPERRLDRHGLPAGRDRPGEGHDSLGGGEHRAAAGSAEIDAAVLAARVRVRMVERKRPQHRAVDGPRPGAGAGDGERTGAKDQDRKSPHRFLLVASFENNADRTKAGVCCQYWLQSTAVELVAPSTGEP